MASESIPDVWFDSDNPTRDNYQVFLDSSVNPARVSELCFSCMIHSCTDRYSLKKGSCRFNFPKKLAVSPSLFVFRHDKIEEYGFSIRHVPKFS